MPISRRFILPASAALLALAAVAPWRAAPAFAADPAEPSRRLIAVVDVVGVVERLMDSDRYKPARDEVGAAAEADVRPLREKVQAIEEKHRGLQPTDPAYADAVREYQQARAALERRAQELSKELDALTTKQLIECYRIVRASADAIAEQMGYQYVVASRPVEKDLDAQDTAAVVRAIIARPVLRFPNEADLTPDVKQDLKIN